jgi:hypothetical protein
MSPSVMLSVLMRLIRCSCCSSLLLVGQTCAYELPQTFPEDGGNMRLAAPTVFLTRKKVCSLRLNFQPEDIHLCLISSSPTNMPTELTYRHIHRRAQILGDPGTGLIQQSPPCRPPPPRTSHRLLSIPTMSNLRLGFHHFDVTRYYLCSALHNSSMPLTCQPCSLLYPLSSGTLL